MAITVGELSVNVTTNTSGFSRGLANIKLNGEATSSGVGAKMVANFNKSFNTIGTVGSAAFQTISGVASTVVNGLTTIGTSLTQNVTLPLGAAALAALKLGKDFESSLSKVTGLVGVASTQVDEWGKEILDLAPELAIAPTELADALFYVTSAGLRGAEAMDVLKMSGKAASAGLGETKTIADLVTSAMNAYGSENLSASQATDILVAAVKEGKAEASELASSMGQVLPIASEMGVSFDQVAASQAAMTKTGTSASEASTQLKSILSGLLKPSQQAEEALEGMGTSSSELRKSIKEKGLMSTLGDLRKLTNKYGEDAMAKVFPNIRALSGVLDLMGSNASDNVEVFDAVADSTGSLDDAFAAASKTLDFKWNQALSQVQATALSFFEVLKGYAVPILEKLVEVLDWVGNTFSNLSPKMQKFFVLFGVAAAAMGPVILMVVSAVTTLVTILGGLIATVAAGVGLWAMFAPIIVTVGAAMTAIIGIISGLVASFIYLWKTNDKFRDNVLYTWNYIKKKGKEIFDNLKKIVSAVLDKIKDFWDKHGNKIIKIANTAWNFILFYIRKAMDTISNIIGVILNLIEGDWSGAWENIKNILSGAWETIKMIASKALNILLEKIKTKFAEIKTSILNKLSEIKTAFFEWLSSLPTWAAEKLEELKTILEEKFGIIKESIIAKLAEWKESILEWFQSMPENIVTLLEGWRNAMVEWLITQNEENKKQFSLWWESIKTWFASIPEKIKTQLEKWGTTISTWYDETKEKIKTKLSEWWANIKTWFSTAPSKIKGFLKNWKQSIIDFYNETKAKIKEKLEEWWTTIKSWFSSVPDKKEIKNSGSKMVNKMTDGAKSQKSDFTKKLGKLIVDIAVAALAIAAVSLLATGREIVQRIITGVKGVSLKSAGQKIVKSLISGIKSMYGKVTSVCYTLAEKIRDFFPFSPAKEGPLQDLDRINFYDSIAKSLNNAKNKLSVPVTAVAEEIAGGLVTDVSSIADLGTATNNKSMNISAINIYGASDTYTMLQELQSTLKRYSGRLK